MYRTEDDGLSLMDVLDRLTSIKDQFPDSESFPIRHYGGPGPVINVVVERDDYSNQYEIVFHTRSW